MIKTITEDNPMVKLEREMRSPVCLKLNGYQVVALKPGFDTHADELELAIQGGVRAYPDMRRVDFYDVELEEGWAYIHIYRDRHVAYLVNYSSSTSISPLKAAFASMGLAKQETLAKMSI
jgi:hypothetical protein